MDDEEKIVCCHRSLCFVRDHSPSLGVDLEFEVEILLTKQTLLDHDVPLDFPDVLLRPSRVPSPREGDFLHLFLPKLGRQIPPGCGLGTACVIHPSPWQLLHRIGIKHSVYLNPAVPMRSVAPRWVADVDQGFSLDVAAEVLAEDFDDTVADEGGGVAVMGNDKHVLHVP